jgi:hypothetical protein
MVLAQTYQSLRGGTCSAAKKVFDGSTNTFDEQVSSIDSSYVYRCNYF